MSIADRSTAMTYEQCGNLLDRIAEEMPPELFRELNGGVILRDEAKLHPMAQDNDLYILGLYVRDNLGRYINIYYGSIVRVFPNKSLSQYSEILRRTLAHELRHHNEFLAGANDLLYYDDEQIAAYLRSKGFKAE